MEKIEERKQEVSDESSQIFDPIVEDLVFIGYTTNN